MPEPIESQYFLAAHISRSHGVDGTVLIIPVVEVADPALFDDVTLVRLQNERGDLIPARIDSVRVQEKDDRISFFVKFEHINNRNEADEIIPSPVFVEKEKVEGIFSESHSWVSFEVYDEQNSFVGTVDGIMQNPAHKILEVSTDTGNKLIPCVDEYIVKVSEETRKIYGRNLNRLDAV